eukprot:m.114777 g.114777  ORF g.114777 m.114777 type:complete len:595 (-) comp9283_c3_seq1:1698-3482(-)
MAKSLAEFVGGLRSAVAVECPLRGGIFTANGHSQTPLSFFIGNESADLDSIACSLSLAYASSLSSNLSLNLPTICIPIINTTRESLPLRTEVMFILKRIEIDPVDLICIDEIDLEAVCNNCKSVSVALVDHNEPSSHQQFLTPHVNQVIDHHKDEKVFPDPIRNIQLIGSCSSLVFHEILLMLGGVNFDPNMCELLLSAIVVDSVNLDESKGRTFPLDVSAADLLEQWSLSPQQALFDAVMEAKFNCSHLTPSQLLIKDYKQASSGRIAVGIPAITLSLQDFFAKDDCLLAMEVFRKEKEVDMLIIMSTVAKPSFARQIAFYAPQSITLTTSWLDRFVDAFERESGLELTVKEVQISGVLAFNQKNISKSRKAVLPFAEDLLARLQHQQLQDKYGNAVVGKKVIGLMGGCGCGKSTVAQELEKMGVCVLNTDVMGHNAYKKGSCLFQEVVSVFGKDILGDNGGINRKALGGKVFADKFALAKLTNILWPFLSKEVAKRIAECEEEIVAVEAALLIAADWHLICDEVWLVEAPLKDVEARLFANRGMSAEKVRNIYKHQPATRNHQVATRTILNDGPIEDLKAAVLKCYKEATSS